MEILTLHVMNTNFHIEISNSLKANWQSEITAWLTYVDKEWSRFRDNNELAQLNRIPKGETIRLSDPLYDVLVKANTYYEKTNGLFSPYLKNEIEENGYTQSFPFTHSTPKTKSIEAITAHDRAVHELQKKPLIFLDHQSVYKNTSQQIDLGGFAKGYAAESVARWLEIFGQAAYGIVDGGGDISVWSNGEKTWTIGISNPFMEEQELRQIRIHNGAIATSNRLYRSWRCHGKKKHHLLNGNTGKPVKTDVVQATVVTNHLLDGEVMAKMCFLLPKKERHIWLKEHFPNSHYYLVSEADRTNLTE